MTKIAFGDTGDLAKDKYDEYNKKLIGLPDPEEVNQNLTDLKKKQQKKMRDRMEFEDSKKKLLIKSFIIFNLYDGLKKFDKIVEEKRENKEFPPPYDPDEIDAIINERLCRVCGRGMSDKEITHVSEIKSRIKKTSYLGKELQNILKENQFHHQITDRYSNEISQVNRMINTIIEDIEELEKEIRKLDDKLKGHEEKQIAEWHIHRKEYEEIARDEDRKFIENSSRLKEAKKEQEKYKELHCKEREKEEKTKSLDEQVKFCEKAIFLVGKIIIEIMQETKSELQEITKQYFFDLIWKKETYNDIVIDEKYNVKLVHDLGYSCYGNAGAAVRQFLALAFTLALHKISGFEAQLIIDSPVGRTSGLHRENLAAIMARVSSEKQIILLFTDDEYDEKISSVLDDIASNRFKLEMTKQENETKMMVLS